MAKSAIIQDLVADKISLSQALDRLLVISLELEDQKVQKWVKDEKDGYKEKEIPEYRYVKVIPMGTYQIVSLGSLITYSNRVLPMMGVPEETKKKFEHFAIYQGIPEILAQEEQAKKALLAFLYRRNSFLCLKKGLIPK
jgi:hypothetical protein